LVHTSDEKADVIQLKIRGKVNQFATITPARVRMTGAMNQNITSRVVIIPDPSYPFKIVEVKPEKVGNIRVEVKETGQEGARQFELSIFNLKNEKARYFDTVVVKTDSEIRPELKISVYGNILEKNAAGGQNS